MILALRLISLMLGNRRKLRKIRRLLSRKLNPAKILIVRNDGLGDFILTLPMVSAIKHEYPHAKIFVLARKSIHGLSPLLPEIDGWIIDSGCLLKRDIKGKNALQIKVEQETMLRELAAYRFDLAIFAYAEKQSAKLIEKSGIPLRVGPLRRSYFSRFNLWYNIPRKQSKRAEYQLNLQILHTLHLKTQQRIPQINQIPYSIEIPERTIMLHPYKRSGTALVWPVKNFQQLAKYFINQKFNIIVIGDHADYPYLQEHFSFSPKIAILSQLSFVQLAGLMRQCVHFFGNSSGPLHLAALLGLPHTGFFPQNNTASATRWRTLPVLTQISTRDHLLMTRFNIHCVQCILKKCEYYPCTEHITFDAAIKSFEKFQLAIPQKRVSKNKRSRSKRILK